MTLRSSLGLAAVCLLSTPALADETVDLLAGQHSDVGDVTLTDADGVLTISIDTSGSPSRPWA